MPIKRCQNNGKSGWKYGDSGKCYTGPGAREKARKQGIAIKISQTSSKDRFLEEYLDNLLNQTNKT